MPQIRFEKNVLVIIPSNSERLLSMNRQEVFHSTIWLLSDDHPDKRFPSSTLKSKVSEFAQVKPKKYSGVSKSGATFQASWLMVSWMNQKQTQTDHFVAVYQHSDSRKPDLYLYATPDETVALDLDGHSYGKVVFQIKREKAIDIAQRIQQEISDSQRSSDNLSKSVLFFCTQYKTIVCGWYPKTIHKKLKKLLDV